MAASGEGLELSHSESSEMISRIKLVLDKMASLSLEAGRPVPRLVAVSKTKPPEMIRVAHMEGGLLHFGENYAQELIEKANHPLLSDLDIRWHFVGHLQRNKTNQLLSNVPKLWMIETIDTPRLASSVDGALQRINPDKKLRVLVQVNTSGEESKHGCQPEDVPSLFEHMLSNCSSLNPIGLMTIGRPDHNYQMGPNPDFELMKRLRDVLIGRFDLKEVELSMGMSADYEHAIHEGSTNLRIGSTIFGKRT
ncbi:PREDICTED: proline synthase co-transcribed bacterial homolog protein-like [Amphimedon queenslandica]|uniref:Pyridoxal phosphate homeostasis protein n=1 Tax=Amphimedon queenslandica TaxID=400682 RepID=A0A1X7VVM2_AMPQE|nr:PREDICTED: proline synthase co-transcribed bacterial homolog protein-like [Amphimedon queenslandica]|eukprot:XP_003382444.1 PREDICTED: proline synthase co-transcribed bacterial homolog protein-like [Amphimedon queenslandica]